MKEKHNSTNNPRLQVAVCGLGGYELERGYVLSNFRPNESDDLQSIASKILS